MHTAPTSDDDQPAATDPLDAISELASLLEKEWPDDAPTGLTLPEPVKRGLDLSAESPDDDLGADFEVVITQEVPLPSLETDPVMLPWRSTVMVDGAEVASVADPMSARTVISEPGGQGARGVRLRVAGVVIEVRVDVTDGPPSVRLGRDVLAGRFWVAVG